MIELRPLSSSPPSLLRLSSLLRVCARLLASSRPRYVRARHLASSPPRYVRARHLLLASSPPRYVRARLLASSPPCLLATCASPRQFVLALVTARCNFVCVLYT
jgi:hypothetical protein